MTRVCQACLEEGCDRIECYFATSEPEDEETISTVTLDELMRGNLGVTETEGDPMKRAA
jgi:hypothetical protein